SFASVGRRRGPSGRTYTGGCTESGAIAAISRRKLAARAPRQRPRREKAEGQPNETQSQQTIERGKNQPPTESGRSGEEERNHRPGAQRGSREQAERAEVGRLGHAEVG